MVTGRGSEAGLRLERSVITSDRACCRCGSAAVDGSSILLARSALAKLVHIGQRPVGVVGFVDDGRLLQCVMVAMSPLAYELWQTKDAMPRGSGGRDAVDASKGGVVGIAGRDGAGDDGRSIRGRPRDRDVVDFSCAVVDSDLLLLAL